MLTVSELRAEHARIKREAEQLLNQAEEQNRGLTPDEQRRFDSLCAELQNINDELPEARRHERLAQGPRYRPAFSYHQPSNALPTEEVEPLGMMRNERQPQPRFGGPLRSFPNTARGHEAAHRAGRWFAATLLGHQASTDWCARNGLAVDVRAALSGGVNTAGGALIPEELEAQVIALMDTFGLCRQFMAVSRMGSDTRTVPRRTGGLTAYFVGENTAGTESDASWDNVTLVAKKLMVLTRMSSEVQEDAIVDLGDEMTSEIALAITEKEDRCGLLGDGSQSFGGIVGIFTACLQAAHPKAKQDAATGHDTLAEIDADDLVKLLGAIPAYAKRGAAWYCNPTTRAVVFDKIKMAGGGNDSAALAALQEDRFLGYPIIESELLPGDLTATYNGAAILGFGNLAQAARYGLRRGITVALSGERWFELDQIGVRGTSRFDINVHSLGDATKKSPFVVLCGKT